MTWVAVRFINMFVTMCPIFTSLNVFAGPVDGNWELWSAWSVCSTSCGPGNETRVRNCPVPLNGGLAICPSTGAPEEVLACDLGGCKLWKQDCNYEFNLRKPCYFVKVLLMEIGSNG